MKNKINIFPLISISTPSRLKVSLEEHRHILNSVANRDIDASTELIETHIRKVLGIIEKKLLEEKK